MEARRAPEYTLEVFADPTCVKEVVKAILHTIFFHRYFIPITPTSRDLLDQTLPAIDDVDLDTLIDQRAISLVRSLQGPEARSRAAQSHRTHSSSSGSNSPVDVTPSGRGQIVVQFLEKKRKKTYFFGKADEEVCWEVWTLDVTCATPKTESEAYKVRRAMEKSLQKTALKIINIVNRDKDHIPPITTTETNPFPYLISVNPRSESIGPRMGIF